MQSEIMVKAGTGKIGGSGLACRSTSPSRSRLIDTGRAAGVEVGPGIAVIGGEAISAQRSASETTMSAVPSPRRPSLGTRACREGWWQPWRPWWRLLQDAAVLSQRLSQFPLGIEPSRAHKPVRNKRIISAISSWEGCHPSA